MGHEKPLNWHYYFFLNVDLVLKDKIIVYDLGGQRIGWADYDCEFVIYIKKMNKLYFKEK